MVAEPYKVKEVKKQPRLQPFARGVALRNASFNTFAIPANLVDYDMVCRGLSAWSHAQKGGFMIGDEAYAGSRNYHHLRDALERVLGIRGVVPAHNRLGAEKLVATTSLRSGQRVLHNGGRPSPLIAANGGVPVDVSAGGPAVDLQRLAAVAAEAGPEGVAWVHVVVCPPDLCAVPMRLADLRALAESTRKLGLNLLLDVSDVFVLCVAERRLGDPRPLVDIAREVVSLGDILILDGSAEPRSDVGAVVASPHEHLFERFRNQVVVFEGLHTYGGMSGRAMEVFALGVEEMLQEEMHEWYAAQVATLADLLEARGIPVIRGGRGIGLDAAVLLGHLASSEWRKPALAAALFLLGGIRAPLDGFLRDHAGSGREILTLEVPRFAYTISHLRAVAAGIGQVWERRLQVSGLRLLEDVEFLDEARFEPVMPTFFPGPATSDRWSVEPCEPHKIAIFEPISTISREQRWEAMRRAGFNTFLLDSADVNVDLLTDSGVSAQSCYQWEGMTDSSDSPFSSPSHRELLATFNEILGYKYIIPTHQGRAAEHIMSQCMIRKGQLVPGNMYFTTTKEHQQMAGGVFRDVIVDEAHDSLSNFPWKGNIDLGKMQACVEEAGGPEGIAYVSFETNVNLAGGHPVSMDNAREVHAWCQARRIPVMFDATRCVENAYFIQKKDARYHHKSIREILRELLSYGDGCTISCKKDFLVNMGGMLACNSPELAARFHAMLRVWEGDISNGGLDSKDMVALTRGLLDSLDDDYIRARVEQTQYLGHKLVETGIPIVLPPGGHAIFLDAKRFLPHIDQDEYPAQALAAAIYIETGVRTMERGNVSKGRDPLTGQNYRPKLELVRLTIPRRVYSNTHMDFVVEGIRRLWEKRARIRGLRMVYEPKALRFFQGRFEPLEGWDI